MSPLFEAEALSLPGRLRPASLRLRAGEIACLIGPNGSGKTSLIHAVAGIGGAQRSVKLEGIDIHRVPGDQRAKLLSFMPASRDVRWPLIARDLIALSGASSDEVEQAIATLELEELSGRRVDRLSTGERSRVLLARALARRPRLLLLDEPLANLDPEWRLRLIDLLRATVREQQQAALVAVHDLDGAARMADRLIVISEGGIAADGEPEAILDGDVIRQVFGVERAGGAWRLATGREGPRSSR